MTKIPIKEWVPSTLDEFIGQSAFKRQLKVEIEASVRQKRAIRPIILSGLQGTGKSTIARIIATERGLPPPIEIVGKGLTHELITSILTKLPGSVGCPPGYSPDGYLIDPDAVQGRIVVIDEAEAAPRAVYEILHAVLEPVNGRCLFIGKCVDGRIRTVWCMHVCFILLTNYLGQLVEEHGPTVSRFPLNYSFEGYEKSELQEVVAQFARQQGQDLDDDAAELIASRSHGMPRAAINMFRRASDFHVVDNGAQKIDYQCVSDMMQMLEIDRNGLDKPMRSYLNALINAGGKLSIQGLSGVLQIEESTILKVIEPILLRKGMISRGSGGRSITSAGRAAISGSADPISIFDSRVV